MAGQHVYGQALKTTHIGKIMGMLYVSSGQLAVISHVFCGTIFDLNGNYILAFGILPSYRCLDGNVSQTLSTRKCSLMLPKNLISKKG